MEETVTGHSAIALKREYWSKTEAECRTALEERVTGRLSTAEVTDVTWKDLSEVGFPVVIRYRMRVPAYAQQVGRRLVVIPSVFTNGVRPVFSADHRTYPIMFPYALSAKDDVEIVLPEGFVLDQPSAPHPVVGAGDVVTASYSVRFNRKKNTLLYGRNSSVGTAAGLAFRAESYPALKELFDSVHGSDGHSLMLKPVAAAASPAN